MEKGVREEFGWNGYTANVMGTTLIDVESVEYDSEQEIKEHYGKGNEPTGYGKGNKKSSGKMTIGYDELERLAKAAIPFGGDILDLPPFAITGTLERKSDGKKWKEVLPGVVIKKIGHKRKQGDTKFLVDLDIVNVIMPKCIPL